MSAGVLLFICAACFRNNIDLPQLFFFLLQICNASEKFTKAMRDVRIQHREDLVVSFGVPVPWYLPAFFTISFVMNVHGVRVIVNAVTVCWTTFTTVIGWLQLFKKVFFSSFFYVYKCSFVCWCQVIVEYERDGMYVLLVFWLSQSFCKCKY